MSTLFAPPPRITASVSGVDQDGGFTLVAEHEGEPNGMAIDAEDGLAVDGRMLPSHR